MHSFAETCFLYLTENEWEIESKFLTRIKGSGLVAMSPKEEAVARWWSSWDWQRYVPVAKETIIANPFLGYAGTFDLLLYDLAMGYFVTVDYKTNEDLEKWYGKYLKAPLSFLKDNSMGKYTLQQNLYSLQLGNIDIPVGQRYLLWLKGDGSFEMVALDNIERHASYALNTRNN